MNLFDHIHDKHLPLDHVVSYKRTVPLERGLCYCLYLVQKHHFIATVLSAVRDVNHVREHNREYGTHLHSQQELIDLHAKDPIHFAPANPVDETSHCLRSDGNVAYRVPLHGRLPWYMRGLDLFNNDQARMFCVHAASLGLHFVRPYHSGNELHHVVCTQNPTETLINHGVVLGHRLQEQTDAAAQDRTQAAQELRP